VSVPIKEFEGYYGFLSNFYECPVAFEGVIYKSSEHAFQAAKSLDPDVRKHIASRETCANAKRAGKRIKPLREDWDYIKDSIMEEIVRDKFARNEDLRAKLLETGDRELIEGNRWNDRYWGVSLRDNEGQNKLGQILMKIRGELRPAKADAQERPTERMKAINPQERPDRSATDRLSF
jgi:ribA/ribD-fused uncharacterized protein